MGKVLLLKVTLVVPGLNLVMESRIWLFELLSISLPLFMATCAVDEERNSKVNQLARRQMGDVDILRQPST